MLKGEKDRIIKATNSVAIDSGKSPSRTAFHEKPLVRPMSGERRPAQQPTPPPQDAKSRAKTPRLRSAGRQQHANEPNSKHGPADPKISGVEPKLAGRQKFGEVEGSFRQRRRSSIFNKGSVGSGLTDVSKVPVLSLEELEALRVKEEKERKYAMINKDMADIMSKHKAELSRENSHSTSTNQKVCHMTLPLRCSQHPKTCVRA